MSISSLLEPHPILRCVQRVGAALDEVAGLEPAYLPVTEKGAALVELEREIARLRALQLRILAVADDVAEQSGARSAGAWLDHRVRLGYAAAARSDRLAAALDSRWHQVAAALAAGELIEAQAEAIVRALEELPRGLEPDVVRRAEAHLVAEAAHFDPRRLRILGRKVLEVVAPEVADRQEQRLVEAEERRARWQTSLSIRSLGDGCSALRGCVPDAIAVRLRGYLESIASPRREGVVSDRPRLAGPRRLGEAFCALLERMPEDHLPRHGAGATTVMVLIDLQELRDDLGVGELATGDRITAGEVRRLACNARLVPAVLGGDSEVLDLGRSARFFGPAQRKAMAIRDRRCRAEGCSIPAEWCEAHHWGTPWSRGGRTDLADGALLCSWHHHRAHDAAYDPKRMPNGDVRFRRRT